MTAAPSEANKTSVAFLFDLDGTLVDSVYQHVLAWQDALDQINISVSFLPRGSGGGLEAASLKTEGRSVTR